MDLPMGVCPTRPTNLVHMRQCKNCMQVLPVVPGLMYTTVSHVCLEREQIGALPTDERELVPMGADWSISESEQEAHFEQLMEDVEGWSRQ